MGFKSIKGSNKGKCNEKTNKTKQASWWFNTLWCTNYNSNIERSVLFKSVKLKQLTLNRLLVWTIVITFWITWFWPVIQSQSEEKLKSATTMSSQKRLTLKTDADKFVVPLKANWNNNSVITELFVVIIIQLKASVKKKNLHVFSTVYDNEFFFIKKKRS